LLQGLHNLGCRFDAQAFAQTDNRTDDRHRIQSYANAQGAQLMQCRQGLRAVAQQNRLRDLQFEPLWSQSRRGKGCLYGADKPILPELDLFLGSRTSTSYQYLADFVSMTTL
jgi:hypothetical protein